MTQVWQFLVDEDTDIAAANELRTRGYDAVAIEEPAGKDTDDPDVRSYAERSGRVLITTDRDFLQPERHRDITVLLVPPLEILLFERSPAVSIVIWIDCFLTYLNLENRLRALVYPTMRSVW